MATAAPAARLKTELVERSRAVLRAIQRSAERIRAYFRPTPSNTPPDLSGIFMGD
jgi:hypothetical protein